MTKILALLIFTALSSQGAVTVYRVRTSGGDYPMTATGFRNAYAACRDRNDPGGTCIVDVEAYSVASTCITDSAPFIFGPQTNGTKNIIIRSSRISELPNTTRVTTSDGAAGTGKLACLENNGTTQSGLFLFEPAVSGGTCQTYAGSVVSHVTLQGIEARVTGNGKHGAVISIGVSDGSCFARQAAQVPHTITIDRVWMHGVDTPTWIQGASTHALTNGVRWNGNKVTLLNSRCEELNSPTTDTPETHCVAAENAPEASVAINNYFDSAIGTIWGGGYPQMRGFNAINVRTYGNEYTRTAWSYHILDWDTSARLDTGNPCIPNMMWEEMVAPSGKWKCDGAGTWQTSAEVRTKRLWTKNGWEIKSARDVLAEGNFIHEIFVTGDQNQYGLAYLVNNVDPTGSANAPWARPEFIKIRYNRSRRTGGGLALSWGGPGFPLNSYTNNVRFEQNLLEGINHITINPSQGGGTLFGVAGGTTGYTLYLSGLLNTFAFRKNTSTYGHVIGGVGLGVEQEDPPRLTNSQFQDYIVHWGYYAQTNPSNNGEACSLFQTGKYGTFIWNNLSIIDWLGRGSTQFNNIFGVAGCPSTAVRLAAGSEGFVNYNSGINGDYRVCLGSGNPVGCGAASAVATSASDGGPLGADAQQISYAISGVSSGTADYAFFEFQIRRADEGQIRYTAYNTAACTGTIKNLANSTVDSWTDAGGTNRDRTHTPIALAAGEYRVRVTCNSRWKEETFVAQ